MTVKRILIILFTIPLIVFLATTILATLADFLGACAYQDGTIQTCTLLGFDISAIYDTTHLIGWFSDGRFLIIWIGLGGSAIWVHDWWIKRQSQQ